MNRRSFFKAVAAAVALVITPKPAVSGVSAAYAAYFKAGMNFHVNNPRTYVSWAPMDDWEVIPYHVGPTDSWLGVKRA